MGRIDIREIITWQHWTGVPLRRGLEGLLRVCLRSISIVTTRLMYTQAGRRLEEKKSRISASVLIGVHLVASHGPTRLAEAG